MRFLLSFFTLCFCLSLFSQEQQSNYRIKKVRVAQVIQVDSVSLNSSWFILKSKFGKPIDTTYYNIDFKTATLTLKQPLETDSLIISYLKYPDFITKTYKQLDKGIIVTPTGGMKRLYQLSQPSETKVFKPFDGLTTSGSISRGVTIGNNQNAVLNSELDLQLSGKLSDKVSLRASIQDANIPLQQSGYSQRLDEFDQVFIEVFSKNWNIRAGDIDLQNSNSYFANFSKRVQGLSVNTTINHLDSKTNIFVSGALVRGQFARSQISAEEGNQGPYKLRGQNGELFVLIVSGSETVYSNGIALKRGENKDYIIDYNAGEIIFNATYPITSEMRITVDYQFSDRNYSRFIVYGGGAYDSEKLNMSVNVYSENDAKNQPLQQNLSSEYIGVLSDAGDNTDLMTAPSAFSETYNANRILYKKEVVNGVETFVFSNNPNDALFSVNFKNVGDGKGNYKVATEIDGQTITAIQTIYEYVAPINGALQGSFEPIIQLIAPTRLQLAVVNGIYQPTEQTTINFELTGSKNDLNLFSSLDDDDNDGFAATFKATQNIIKNDSLWNLDVFVNSDYIDTNFKTIEQLYNAEFNRDWNIETTLGHQTLIKSGLNLKHHKKGNLNYQFEHLNFSENFNGNRHVAFGNLHHRTFHIFTNSSFLTAKSNLNSSTFLRSFNRITYQHKKGWIGTKISLEDNVQRELETETLTDLSQRYKSYELFTGIGDSTAVFIEIGYKNRTNDSIKNMSLQKVNTSNTYYLKSKLIENDKTNLALYANYRTLDYEDETIEKEQSLNSRLLYNQKAFNQVLLLNSIYETNSGTLPQQEFTYVEVESGQGTYTWIDYNDNGIQELEEFEVAQFQDEGNYIKVLLPNQIFLKTHQNRLSQTLTFNPISWSGRSHKIKNFFSHFYNQISYLIDRKLKREGNNFNLNPFENSEEDQLGLQHNFRNIFFFNRGKQRYTTSYTYLSNKTRNVLSFGFIEHHLKSHQFNLIHKVKKSWLFNFKSTFENNESISQNFESKNFNIDEFSLKPKLSYLHDNKLRFDVFAHYASKVNTIRDMETLEQQNYGLSFSYNNTTKSALSMEFNYILNAFEGDTNTPVGYQMMDGLQNGKNYTWTIIAQKKLTKFLDLNLNYFGRKTELSEVIHTGTVQLKAYF
ncbi:MAG: hypothetical protein HRT67_10190 [Flavobacteriaceae bacterium]|nr:hypothetical protein [Flavobacteriaceae bacterium]